MTAFFRKLFQSLRYRIFILLLIFAIAPGFVLRAGVISAYQSHAINERIDDTVRQIRLLAVQIDRSNYLADPATEPVKAVIPIAAGLRNLVTYITVRKENRNVIALIKKLIDMFSAMKCFILP